MDIATLMKKGSGGTVTDLASSQARETPQKEFNVLEQAEQKYPYLKGKGLSFSKGKTSDGRKLEYWPINEKGNSEFPRPKDIPLEKAGVEVFSDDVRPIDILGDYVSHEGVNKDPVLKRLYGQFDQSTDQSRLEGKFKHEQQNFNEKRDFGKWKERSGLPSEFRGYTFKQWKPDADGVIRSKATGKDVYNQNQLQIMNQVREYLGVQ